MMEFKKYLKEVKNDDTESEVQQIESQFSKLSFYRGDKQFRFSNFRQEFSTITSVSA